MKLTEHLFENFVFPPLIKLRMCSAPLEKNRKNTAVIPASITLSYPYKIMQHFMNLEMAIAK